jgi:hypothetical protein
MFMKEAIEGHEAPALSRGILIRKAKGGGQRHQKVFRAVLKGINKKGE